MLSNSTRKLLWFEITKMLIAILKIKFVLLFIIIFGTHSFLISYSHLLFSRPVLTTTQPSYLNKLITTFSVF